MPRAVTEKQHRRYFIEWEKPLPHLHMSILCTFLVLSPTPSHADDVHFGGGYILKNVLVQGFSDNKLVVELRFFNKGHKKFQRLFSEAVIQYVSPLPFQSTLNSELYRDTTRLEINDTTLSLLDNAVVLLKRTDGYSLQQQVQQQIPSQMQTTKPVSASAGKLYRSKRPVALGIGLDGAGAGITIGGRVSLEATSFIVNWVGKAKLLVLHRNGTPFVGFGFGGSRDFGGSSSSWSLFCFGWQEDYERISVQMGVQLTIDRSPAYGKKPFPVSLSGWYRI